MSESGASPGLPIVHIARALGWRVDRWDELRLELAAIEGEADLSQGQKTALSEWRAAELGSLGDQLQRLSAVRAEHLAGMSEADAAAFVLEVATGRQVAAAVICEDAGDA
jgi:hypothetical protein